MSAQLDAALEDMKAEAQRWQARLGYIQMQLDSLVAEKRQLVSALRVNEDRFQKLAKAAGEPTSESATP